tara:strand:+ start:215 stop:454 length:240 start_codon:yes stop_codon:yes gene_type:complete
MAQFRTGLLNLTVSEGGTVYMEEDNGFSIIISPSQVPTLMLALSQALVNKKDQEMAENREALLQSLADGANKLCNVETE